jgi:hypothetical protein
MVRRTLIAALALLLPLVVAACQTTVPAPEPLLPRALVGQSMQAALMAATVGAEVAINVADPPGLATCPNGTHEGDDLTLDYGAGCFPASGITDETLGGAVQLTVAGGSGVFVGDLESMGFENLPLVGEISGSVSRAGDLLSADVEFRGLTWTEDGSEVVADVLFEIAADADGFVFNASAANFMPGWQPDILFELEEVTATREGLGSCFVPDGGTLLLDRDSYTATIVFSEETASSGDVQIDYNDRDSEPFSPCN